MNVTVIIFTITDADLAMHYTYYYYDIQLLLVDLVFRSYSRLNHNTQK